MLNLKYGQQAVARGYITPQRLQQVLAKQRQLSDQGKKVSVRMILEKSKLLLPDQLDQIDRDLNIKVVKKKTGVIEKPVMQQRQAAKPVQAMSAANFAGDDALPDVSGSQGVNPDATIYSPPPPDMQERIRQEREKAKAAVRQRQDQQVGPSRQAPGQPQRAPMRQPQPQPQFAEPMMEPEMEPEPFGEDAAPELERMDSSPKLESLPAEYQGVMSPEAEALPTLDGGGFDQFGESPQPGGFDNLAPAEQGFDQFGESPQGDMMSGTAALGAEPEEGGNWGEDRSSPSFDEGPSAMEATIYSPPPPRGGHEVEAAPMAPSFDSFGEDDSPAAPSFGDDGGIPGGEINATLYSPPPANFQPAQEALPEPEAEPEMAEPFADQAEPFGEPEPVAPPPPEPVAAKSAPVSGRKLPPGKKPVDDFADAGAPEPVRPREQDDVPTVKPRGDTVHPLRRGVSAEIDALKEQSKPPTGKTGASAAKAEAPKAEPAPTTKRPSGKMPLPDLPEDDEPAPSTKKPSAKLDAKAAKAEKEKAKATPKPGLPAATAVAEEPPKKSKSRTLLIFMLLLLVVVAALVVPVVPDAQNTVPQLRQLRNHEKAKVIYDNVEKWANQVRAQFGLPPWNTGSTPMKSPAEALGAGDDAPKTDGGTTDGGTDNPPKESPKEEPKEEPKPDAEAQWKALYKPGASWVVRMNMGMEMWQKTEVLSIEGNKARIRTSMKMKADEEFANPNESDIEFKKPDTTAVPDPKYKELGKGEEKIGDWETTWVESEYDGAKTKTWMSKKYPALLVKMTNAQGSMELVEFTEGK